MQHRMKENPLNNNEITTLLEKTHVGTLSTLNADGAPYAIPVHFVYMNDAVYMHGLPAGQKIDNIKKDNRVCFEAHEMSGYITADVDMACDVNTEYQSVIMLGTAIILQDIAEKEVALNEIVNKYTPSFSGKKLPENMITGTAVIKITPTQTTGKFYK